MLCVNRNKLKEAEKVQKFIRQYVVQPVLFSLLFFYKLGEASAILHMCVCVDTVTVNTMRKCYVT